MHLNDALGHKDGLHCIYNHNEQGSAIAAEAYNRLTGKIATICVTSGPGGTNAITGVIGGWLDSIPMFILSGQVKREVTIWSVQELPLRQLGDQEFDIVHSVANMTKYAVMVTEPQDIAYHLEKAWFLCRNGRGGPVWLDIPLDVQGTQIETGTLRHFDSVECIDEVIPAVSIGLAREVLEKIQKAQAPLILAGGGIHLSGAEEEFLRLVEKLQIPVVTAWNSTDILAFDNPLCIGMPGTLGTRPGNFAVQNCDLLLSLGCRLNLRMIGYNKYDFAKNAYKIIVDIDENELKKPTINPDIPVWADVKQFMNLLLEQPYEVSPVHVSWVQWCNDVKKAYPAVLESYHHLEGPVNPYVFMDELFKVLKSDDIVVTGNGSACVVSFQAGAIKQGQRLFTNSGCAAMGYGLPAALGVAVARKGKRVICLDGDGSIMMNIQEMATISYNKLDICIFLLNNDGYHSIRQTQANLFKPPLVGVNKDNGVGFPDFKKLSEAFGFRYHRIENEKMTDAVLKNVLSSRGPLLCEVMLDPSQKFEPKSSSKVLSDGRIVSPSLDDMAPFLERDEFEKIRYFKNVR